MPVRDNSGVGYRRFHCIYKIVQMFVINNNTQLSYHGNIIRIPINMKQCLVCKIEYPLDKLLPLQNAVRLAPHIFEQCTPGDMVLVLVWKF